MHADAEEQLMVIENWEGIREYVGKAISIEADADQLKLQRVELLLNKELLKVIVFLDEVPGFRFEDSYNVAPDMRVSVHCIIVIME